MSSKALLCTLLLLPVQLLLVRADATAADPRLDIKGPPVAQQKEMKSIVRLGEEVKLQCPITGNPPPIIEWRKGEDIIDYSWIRIRTQKKWMKMRKAQEEDTGVYICKGVNGFGNVEVRVDLIVIDPSKFPDLQEGQLPDVSAPSFTPDTINTKDFYAKQSGDNLKINCEATGNPRPEIFWYKDGLPFEADGIKYKNGKSVLKLRKLIKGDSAQYTCQARNLVGSVTRNFTLKVEVPMEDQPTVVGNGNSSVLVGDTASLQCRVKSIAPPHIKWLKKQNPDSPNDQFTINVGEDRYKVIYTGEDIPVGSEEYLNKLVIFNAQESDSGLYICFVTNSGGSFNYKPSYLRVYPAAGSGGHHINNINNNHPLVVDRPDNYPAGGAGVLGGDSTHILALVVCLGVTVVLILIFIIVCVVRKSSKAAGHSTADSPEVVRNLMGGSGVSGGGHHLPCGPMPRSTQSSSTITTVASQKLYEHPLPPPPPSMWSCNSLSSTAKNNNNEYMTASRDFSSSLLHENSSQNLLSDRESPVSVTSGHHQYEVPYCHSIGGRYNAVPSLSNGVEQQHQQQQQAGGNSGYPFHHYPYFQYLNDYDSY